MNRNESEVCVRKLPETGSMCECLPSRILRQRHSEGRMRVWMEIYLEEPRMSVEQMWIGMVVWSSGTLDGHINSINKCEWMRVWMKNMANGGMSTEQREAGLRVSV